MIALSDPVSFFFQNLSVRFRKENKSSFIGGGYLEIR